MTDIEQFFADLPPHMQPSNPTEKLLMSYAWYEGHAQGLKTGLSYANQSLLRLVPKREDAA